MKYQDKDQVRRILDLQNEAEDLRQKAVEKLSESDHLTSELVNEIGNNFVCDGIVFKIESKAIGFGQAGNRRWLLEDKTIKIIK